MSSAFRTFALLGALVALSCSVIAIPVDATAKTTHAKKHKRAKKNTGNTKLRTAQTHLANLGYYKGKVDGLNGPKTKAAIKSFQREHGISLSGNLTPMTYAAIIAADKNRAMAALPMPHGGIGGIPPSSPGDFYAKHPDFYGYYDQKYENAGILGFPQGVYSRFAKLDLTENMDGALKRYTIMLNGQAILMDDGQPSVIGISRTYTLGGEDAILFTSYREGNPNCAYQHHLLVLNEHGNKTYDVKNCTRGYQAKVANDSLFITFPEADDNRDVGATWRYESGDLERL